MKYQFRKAQQSDVSAIWEILEKAIVKRRNEGSQQWQDGYPNLSVVENDVEHGNGYVLASNNEIVAYTAVLVNDEPQYKEIIGRWQTNGDFVVYHRVAVAEHHLGKGIAQILLKEIEAFAFENGIYSVKADTNHDNVGMLKVFEKLGYIHCGEVTFRGSPRMAFEKVLDKG